MPRKSRQMPNDLPSARCRALWDYERQLIGRTDEQPVLLAGVDEAGRGCLAGPVVAAAVVLGRDAEDWQGIDDSKRLGRARREQLYERIVEQAQAVAVGVATVAEIDELNILQASRLAMARAIERLSVVPDWVLVDGPYPPSTVPANTRCLPVVDGDAHCLSIAAASIVAKVERDKMMAALADTYPEYGFDRNAGYGTAEHRRALATYGPTPWHRRSFAPVTSHMQLRLSLDG
jgi:ribonuclease HII